MPEPLEEPVLQSVFADSDHNTLIHSFRKRHNTVETSTYGAELVVLRIARDIIVANPLKLKSIGVPILGPVNLYCDNQGVVKNTSIPESTLSKKHNSINYHIVREAAAAGILRVRKEDTEMDLADANTKLMPY
ncbi:hypothetical protein ACHAWF_014512 [Thalassiosira exigua]